MTDPALLWKWARVGWTGERWALPWLLVGSTLVGVGQAAFTAGWKWVIDAAPRGQAAEAGLLLLLLGAAQSALYVAVQGTRTRVNHRIQTRVRDRVFDHLTRVRPGALRAWRVGDLVARLTDDISDDKLGWFLCSGVFRAWEAACVVTACVGVMLWMDPALTAWTLLPLPAFVVTHLLLGRRFGRVASAAQAALSRTIAVAQDALDGVRVVQAHALEPLARRALAEAARAQADREVERIRVEHGMTLEMTHGWQIGVAALLVAGAERLAAGTLEPSTFVVFTGFGMTLVFQMYDFAAFAVRSRITAASLRRVEELERLPAGEAPPTEAAVVEVPERMATAHLKLRLSAPLRLVPGTLLAVTGPVGAGKSTLLRAIAGEEPGVAVPRPRPGWVPQDPVVFAGTVRENLTLGLSADPTPAAAAACLGPDLARWPAGLDTVVGEKGMTLSGGQQQRVQLARALYADPPLLLLDDATSALDADTEARFWAGFDRSDRVVVVVTHRPATLAQADLVLYLREGVEVARGTHAELLARSEAYRAAYG